MNTGVAARRCAPRTVAISGLIALVVLVFAGPAARSALADDFVLERVVVESRNGASAATPVRTVIFDVDPETGGFETDRIIVAPFEVGRRGYSRFTLKFDDLAGTHDGELRYRSFECVEGTLGAVTRTSHCGNYRFGANDADDGGASDDVRVGPPLSLDGFAVSVDNTDEQYWVIMLTAEAAETSGLYPLYAIRFELRAAPGD